MSTTFKMKLLRIWIVKSTITEFTVKAYRFALIALYFFNVTLTNRLRLCLVNIDNQIAV